MERDNAYRAAQCVRDDGVAVEAAAGGGCVVHRAEITNEIVLREAMDSGKTVQAQDSIGSGLVEDGVDAVARIIPEVEAEGPAVESSEDVERSDGKQQGLVIESVGAAFDTEEEDEHASPSSSVDSKGATSTLGGQPRAKSLPAVSPSPDSILPYRRP